MDTRAVTRTFAANLFLQPSVVRYVIDYFLGSHTPLDELTDGKRCTRLSELESDTRALANALLARPSDFVLLAQVGVLGREVGAKPRVQAIYHWLGNAFAIPDVEFLRAHFLELTTTLATMVAAPGQYWANVVRGDMIAHVHAHAFRFTDVLAELYWPVYMVVHMVFALLDKIKASYDAHLLHVHARPMLVAIGKGLVPHSSTTPRLSAQETALVARLTEKLLTITEFEVLYHDVELVVANLNTCALKAYANLRDQSPLVGGDVEAVMTRAFA